MSAFLDGRDEEIRRKFARYSEQLKRRGERKFATLAIEQLTREYNAFGLKVETMRQICQNKNYRKPAAPEKT